MLSEASAQSGVENSPSACRPERQRISLRMAEFHDSAKRIAELETPQGRMDFRLNAGTFIPDNWSEVLLRGLATMDMREKTFLEIGVGSGVISAYVLACKQPRAVYASDLRGDMTSLAAENIRHLLPERAHQCFFPCCGHLNLASWVKNPLLFDGVFGCLPKLPSHVQRDSTRLNPAVEYDRDRYESSLHRLGLGLHDALLAELQKMLRQSGTATFIFDGCIGTDALHSLFRKHHFRSSVLHEEVHPVHRDAALDDYACTEQAGEHLYKFFEDHEGVLPIDARSARDRLRSLRPVYHRLTVLQGVRM